MSSVDRYVQQVMDRVYASASEQQRLAADLRASFEQGLAEGATEAAIRQRLGTPEEVAEAFMAGVELQYAGFWARVAAFLADMALFVVASMPVLAVGVLLNVLNDGEAVTWSGILVIAAIASIGLVVAGVFIFYFPVLEHHFGATFGKWLMGLQVRTESGARIRLGAAFLRRISMYFEFLVLDALFVPFTKKKQRAFDIVAKTIVVRDPDRPARAGAWLLSLAVFVGAVAAVAVLALLIGVWQ
jgi:uncharacterized RDD family membrane protein YckC